MDQIEYYYLDANNKPNGPHSIEELRHMLETGALQADAMISFKGAESWQPLAAVCSNHPDLPPEQPGYTAPMQQTAARAQYSDNMGLFDVFVFVVFKNYINFSGRATRREYWGFILINFLLYILAAACGALTTPLLCNIYSILVALPSIAVLFRRLHDVGRSGWWYLWSLLSCIPYLIVSGHLIWNIILISKSADETTMLEEQYSTQLSEKLTPLLVDNLPWLILSVLPVLIISTIIFIFTLKDSQKGTNAYGPSYKYPDSH